LAVTRRRSAVRALALLEGEQLRSNR